MKVSLSQLKSVAVTLVSAALFAAGMELFIIPNGLNIGGFGGIAQFLSLLNIKYITTGIWLIIVNVPVFVTAFLYIDRSFAVRTTAEVILAGALMELFNVLSLAERWQLVADGNLAVIAIIGGLLVAAASAFMIGTGGSTGGNDVLGFIVQRRYKLSNVTRLLTVIDVAIATAYSLAVGDFMLTVYSVTALVAYQVALEMILNGLGNAIMFEIVTEDASAVVEAISKELDRGTTKFKAIGTYSGREKEVVVCVVGRRQEAEARALIKRVAPDSFAYEIPIKSVLGEGFIHINYN